MADVSKIQLPSGSTYNLKDRVSGYITAEEVPVTSVQGETGDVVLSAELSVAPSQYAGYGTTDSAFLDDEDPNSLVGSYTGTATTSGPSYDDTNYTPRGEIVTTSSNIQYAESAELDYSYSNYRLTINGVKATTNSVPVVSSAQFVGVPDKIIIDIQGGQS